MLMKGMTLVMMIFAVLKIFSKVSKAGEIHVFKSVCLSKAPDEEILFDSDNDEPSSELLLQDYVYDDDGDGSAVVAAPITSRWCNCSSGRAAIIRVMRKPHHHHHHRHHHYIPFSFLLLLFFLLDFFQIEVKGYIKFRQSLQKSEKIFMTSMSQSNPLKTLTSSFCECRYSINKSNYF